MKIGMKISLGFAITIVLIVIIALVSISGLSGLNENVDNLVHDRYPKTVWANNVIDAINEGARALRNATITKDVTIRDEQIKRVLATTPKAKENLDSLISTIKSDEGKAILKKINDAKAGYIENRTFIINHLMANEIDAAVAVLFGEFRKYQTNYFDGINELIQFQGKLFAETAEEAENQYNSSFNMLIILTLIALIVAILIAWFVSRQITKPIQQAVVASDAISHGNLNTNLESKSKDETGQLLAAMKAMSGNLTEMVKELNVVSEAAFEGKLDRRANEAGFEGEYKNIMVGFNKTLDAVIGPLNMTAEYVDRISKGDIPPRITDEYKGDFNEIKNNLNQAIDAVDLLVKDAVMLAKAAVDGKLDTRADASKHFGDFRAIVEGVNQTLDNVIEPINEAAEVLSQMSTGDLTVRMLNNYNGDLAKLKNDINALGDSLSQLINQVSETVQNTASAALEISSTAEGLAASSQEQSAQADEVASAVEEMSRTVTENAMAATRTAEVAQQNGAIASEGAKVVKQTVVKMRDIADVVRHSADNIQKLGDSSKQIGEIISVIDDIADQTNLLALNAAIEAARAGEQGRGFAVVADEVRKLAERTTEATKQIASMIKGIQGETEQAVVAMNQGTHEVQSGIEYADRAGESLNSILSSTQELLDMINQIAAASEEQSATSEQISKNVMSISKVTAESTQRVEDVARTSDELARLTEHLRDLMGNFQVDDGNSASYSTKHLANKPKKQLRS